MKEYTVKSVCVSGGVWGGGTMFSMQVNRLNFVNGLLVTPTCYRLNRVGLA